METIRLSKGSDIEVYNPPLQFFLSKIEAGEHFSFTRQLHGFWDAIIGALIISPELRKLRLDDEYLKTLSKKMVEAKSAMTLLRYNPQVYFDVLKFITTIDKQPENLFFGISDLDFYPQNEPPYSVNSYLPNFKVFRLLKTKSKLRCYKLRCGDRQEIIRYFLPNNYTPLNGIIWRKYGYNSELATFFEKIRHHRIVTIGPAYYHKLGDELELRNHHHISIHPSKASDEREVLLQTIHRFHNKIEDDSPTIYFIIAGTLGTWLVSKLHGQLSNSFILDVGLALDPLFRNEATTASNPYSFSGFGKKKNGQTKRYKTERKDYFLNEDLGCKLEINKNGKVEFLMPRISRLNCELKCFKTRAMYAVYNKLKAYRFSNFTLTRFLRRQKA